MTPTNITKSHVIRNYIEPARLRGDKTVTVRVGNVLKELGWTNRTPSVFSTLCSQAFQHEAGVELIAKKGGPESGGPSTTVQFVYGLNEHGNTAGKKTPSGGSHGRVTSLLDLYGIFADGYREHGGSEAFMKEERDWGPDVWERYEAEKSRKSGGKS